MNTIIAGSRDITNYELIDWAMKHCKWSVTSVLCGGARGADNLGREWAKVNNIPVKMYPAQWDKYGRSAGYKRNAEMALDADALIALWDGKSRGTEHMVNLAKKQKLKILLINTTQRSITTYN